MAPYLSEVDKWVTQAFDSFINDVHETGNKTHLHKVAIEPNGQQEIIIEEMFLGAIKSQVPYHIAVSSQTVKNYGDERYKHDIVACDEQDAVFVVEIKSPFTNHDGIRFHTGKNRSLTKDSNALSAALHNGAVGAYELITLYECYAVNSRGEVIVLESAMKRNEDAIKAKYNIHWPTRKDYKFRQGEEDIDSAMERIADELEMRSERITGWTRIEISSTNSKTRTFLDCALFRVKGV